MGIVVASNFDLQTTLPLDSRTVVADTTARDAIPSGVRYEGLIVYVTADETNYQLVGGITNSDWQELSGSGGGGGGSGLIWFTGNDVEPIAEIVGKFRVWNFASGEAQQVNATYNVPANYEPGTQLLLTIQVTSLADNANDGYFEFDSHLLNTSNIVSPWNHSDDQIKTGWVSGEVYTMTFEITDSSGLIGGIAVAPLDKISLELYRINSAGTENTNDILVLRDTMEVP